MNTHDKYYTIFVVEDSDVYRSIIMQELQSENETSKSPIHYNVYGFTSGEECIEHAYLKPDIMIMDYLLNGNGYLSNMNGLELLKRIKNIIPQLDVIVLSCQNNIKVIKDFMRAGIREYIKKEGIGQHKVKQVIREHVEKIEKKNKRLHIMKNGILILAFIALISVILFSLIYL
ncbi:MAG TPA: response regulator [Bacteroidia bacterium]|nr:response regulator [Bacteroidia bacterium]